MITVGEIMSANPITLSPADTLDDARDLMKKRHIRHIPVLDDAGALAGLVTHRDVLAASGSSLAPQESPGNPGETPIGNFMTRDLATIDKTSGLRQAALYLQQHKFGCLLVTRDGRLEGIITDSDFVAVAINLLEQMESTEPVAVDP